jgi:hypothetical protein
VIINDPTAIKAENQTRKSGKKNGAYRTFWEEDPLASTPWLIPSLPQALMGISTEYWTESCTGDETDH